MFWNSLELAGQIYFCAACIASVMLIVQLVLLFVGSFTHLDLDIFDVDDGGIGMFSLKGMTAFFAVGGWSATGAILGGLHWGWSIPIFVVAGAVAQVGMVILYRIIGKVRGKGIIAPHDAIGLEGEVYSKVPAAGQGRGKICILVHEMRLQCDAINKSNISIPIGTIIKVISVVGDTYVVESMRGAGMINAN